MSNVEGKSTESELRNSKFLVRYSTFGLGCGCEPHWKEGESIMKWFINSMLGYWILLLAISLGAAAVVYEIWLKGRV
jgi:hypothetical protein